MSNGKPTHRVKIAGPAKADGGKSYWTTIGSAWQHTDGRMSVSINEGVQLLLTRQVRLVLAPVEEK